MLTPIETHAGYLVKRDDRYELAGVAGGKVRTCAALSQAASGLVTAGARHSPQISIVARVAEHAGIPAVCVTAPGSDTPEISDASRHGATIVRAKVGYTNVLSSTARRIADETGYTLVPFGMECAEAVYQTAGQVENVASLSAPPYGLTVRRIVVPVGSGMSLAGILTGLERYECDVPVLGVVVGANPTKRLDRYAPIFWQSRVSLVDAGVDYATSVHAQLGDLVLDPIYEAKCVAHMRPGDLLWVVGVRATIGAHT